MSTTPSKPSPMDLKKEKDDSKSEDNKNQMQGNKSNQDRSQ